MNKRDFVKMFGLGAASLASPAAISIPHGEAQNIGGVKIKNFEIEYFSASETGEKFEFKSGFFLTANPPRKEPVIIAHLEIEGGNDRHYASWIPFDEEELDEQQAKELCLSFRNMMSSLFYCVGMSCESIPIRIPDYVVSAKGDRNV